MAEENKTPRKKPVKNEAVQAGQKVVEKVEQPRQQAINIPTEDYLREQNISILDWLDTQPSDIVIAYWKREFESVSREKNDLKHQNSTKTEKIEELTAQLNTVVEERDKAIRKYNNLMRLYNLMFTHNINDL